MAKPIKYTVSDGKLVLTLEVAEEGGYVVTAPLNPEVLTQADSLEEAFEMARDVIALFEEDRNDRNGPIKKRPPRRRKQAVS
ncbi:MAG TPA: type II toxin-antitoxin system HicB family antitoxin [Urbifossiella sp.]|jgi:predicted RNase H-like HicB family nuclease|nr:type II toxin-antitoxin system HicB family antitoxin [Urbifossiella sp.]